MKNGINEIKVNHTRFAGLGFAKIAVGLWMFVDIEADAQIGPHYVRKDELLADIHRFAVERGFEVQ